MQRLEVNKSNLSRCFWHHNLFCLKRLETRLLVVSPSRKQIIRRQGNHQIPISPLSIGLLEKSVTFGLLLLVGSPGMFRVEDVETCRVFFPICAELAFPQVEFQIHRAPDLQP
jgi:hypothetical protein